MSRVFQVLLAVLMALLSLNSFAGDEPAGGVLLWALEVPVNDTAAAIEFYTTVLGFQVEEQQARSSVVELINGEARIVLRPDDQPQAGPDAARAYLNMTVGDIPFWLERVRAGGGSVSWSATEESAVGPYMEIQDPSGNPIHLIDHPWDDMTGEQVPSVFNFGLRVHSIEESEPFFTALGFSVSTREYLPTTLVFNRQGVAYFVMHPQAGRSLKPGEAAGCLVVSGADAVSATRKDGRIETDPSGIRVRYLSPGQRSVHDE